MHRKLSEADSEKLANELPGLSRLSDESSTSTLRLSDGPIRRHEYDVRY